MTQELKALMEQESDRADNYFAPDPDAILAAGRRRQRVRTLGVGATVLTTLAVLTAGVGLVVEHQHKDVPVAGLPGRPQDAYKQCDTSSGRRLGKDSWSWPEIVILTDAYGSASLRRDPSDPDHVAYCVTQPDLPSGNLPLAQNKGILVRKSAASASVSVTSVFGRVYNPDATVRVSVGAIYTTSLAAAKIEQYSPPTNPGEATIGGTYYVYRAVDNSIWPGPRPVVSVATFSANGYKLGFGEW